MQTPKASNDNQPVWDTWNNRPVPASQVTESERRMWRDAAVMAVRS